MRGATVARMLASRGAIVWFVAALAACAGAPGDGRARDALDRLRADHVEALAAGDLARYLEVFAPDAELMVPDGATAHGRDAIEAAVAPFFAAFTTHEDERPREVVIGVDRAFEWGELTVTMVPRDGGAAATSHGKYLFFARRDPARAGDRFAGWRYTHLIWNGDLPVRAAAADGPLPAPVEQCTPEVVWLPPGSGPLIGADAVAVFASPRAASIGELVVGGAWRLDDALVLEAGSLRDASGAPRHKYLAVRRGAGRGPRIHRLLWCGAAD